MQGRRVLVTGASSGIGAAVARAIADAGGQVALLARRRDALVDLAAELDGVALPADVTDPAQVAVAVDRAAEELGGLDGVVTAAGLARPGGIRDADPADWRTMFEVNVLGTLHAVRAALPHLTASEHADVVTVSSMSGRRVGSADMAVYAASKSAVHTLSEGLRRELAPDGIRVTVVAPGFVDTPIFEGQQHPAAERLREAAAHQGLPADDVADRIVEVLASPPHVLHVEVALLSIDQA